MNAVSLIGRLVDDPEVKKVGKGKDAKKVCNFTIAVQRSKDVADFVDCSAWDGRAEFLEEYFSKGQRVGITGSIRKDCWEDDFEVKRYKTYVIVNSIDFCENAEDSKKK